MKEGFSPNRSPRTSAIAEIGFSQGENTAFGDYYKYLRTRLVKPTLQKSSTDLTFVTAHWYKSDIRLEDLLELPEVGFSGEKMPI